MTLFVLMTDFTGDGDINNPKALEDKEEVDEEGNPLYVQVLDNTDPRQPCDGR
jgi:hypothetical protein